MLWTPYWPATSPASSTSSFTTLSLPAYSLASASTVGATARQGPHQAAQKSTSTGNGDWRTSASKFSLVTASALDMDDPPRESKTSNGRPLDARTGAKDTLRMLDPGRIGRGPEGVKRQSPAGLPPPGPGASGAGRAPDGRRTRPA